MARKAVSLSDLNKKVDKDEKQNEFFAGGLDQRGGGSGLSILGPPPNPSSSSSVFDRIVQQAQSNSGATSEGASASSGGSSQRVITMYRNGFTIDDGPFRAIDAPENQAFIQSLTRGMVPPELQGGSNEDLDVALNDKREEDYVAPPPPSYVAFSRGTTLGSTAESQAWVANPEDSELSTAPTVDDSKPTCTLQVKTLDGKRLKIKLNNSATVLQLAAAIRSQGVTEAFSMNAGYPPKDLCDSNATLTDAGLVGASVTLKKV